MRCKISAQKFTGSQIDYFLREHAETGISYVISNEVINTTINIHNPLILESKIQTIIP